MANIQTGSGNGFYQMLGSQRLQSQRANAFEQMAIAQEQSQPQMPEPMDEPEEEMGDIPQGKMVDGVEYIRLPSGKWRNSKTGQTVTYPRGKYND